MFTCSDWVNSIISHLFLASDKVVFKKPTKDKEGKASSDSEKKKKKESKMAKVKNTTLLSFGDDEEEDT